jgi:hypothetical protein
MHEGSPGGNRSLVNIRAAELCDKLLNHDLDAVHFQNTEVLLLSKAQEVEEASQLVSYYKWVQTLL